MISFYKDLNNIWEIEDRSDHNSVLVCMISLFFKHMINFVQVYYAFFVQKKNKEDFKLKTCVGVMIIKELIFTTISMYILSTAIRTTEYLPPYLIYDAILGLTMVVYIFIEKYFWHYKLISYEKDYFKWQALNKLKTA